MRTQLHSFRLSEIRPHTVPVLLSLIQKVRNILGLLIQISHFELVALLQRMFASKMEPLVYVYMHSLFILWDLDL